jgi:type IV secretory pathway VirJ component
MTLQERQKIVQQFLIVSKTGSFEAFTTNWYSYENNYQPDMIVIDLLNGFCAYDGKKQVEVQEDFL